MQHKDAAQENRPIPQLHNPLMQVSVLPLQLGSVPHLQVPSIHISFEVRSQDWAAPQKHCPATHVSDNPVQESSIPHLHIPF